MWLYRGFAYIQLHVSSFTSVQIGTYCKRMIVLTIASRKGIEHKREQPSVCMRKASFRRKYALYWVVPTLIGHYFDDLKLNIVLYILSYVALRGVLKK